MKGKILHAGHWVRVRNFMNTKFPAASPCSICRRAHCGMVWFHIHTEEVRCLKCFDPEKEES